MIFKLVISGNLMIFHKVILSKLMIFQTVFLVTILFLILHPDIYINTRENM